MKADELQRIATRLSNQCFVRHWLHFNAPYHPVVMAIELRNSLGESIQAYEMRNHGFEWNDTDRRYYVKRDPDSVITSAVPSADKDQKCTG